MLPANQPDWPHALALLGPKQALRDTTGHFAMGAELPDGSTVLGTDRFGLHSVCWHLADGRLQFAERADAFGVKELDPQALFDYLFFHAIPSPRTVFRDVHRVPAAHLAQRGAGDSGIRLEPYWRPQFTPQANPSFGALRSEFRKLLRDAVANELDGSTPACFLSGGTDSSSVTGVVREVAGRVCTYSIGFDAAGYDEMEFARIAARHFGAEHHEYYVTPNDLVRSIPEVAASYDQPFGNSSALPAYYCALQARKDGVTKLLAGDGGDELFGGNSRYAMQQVYGLYSVLPSILRGGLVDPLFGNDRLARVPLLRKGTTYVRHARQQLPDRLNEYNLIQLLGPESVLTRDFLAAVSTSGPADLQREVWQSCAADNDTDRMLAYDWRFTLAEVDLPKVMGACRLAGVAAGFPLLDRRLLEFSMRLPPSYKVRRFKLRWFFKEALRGFLPDEIITKKKKGFGLPFGVWALQHQGLHALAVDSLRSFATRGIVQPAFVTKLVERHLPAHPGYYGELVWILMMLEQWLRHHCPDYRFRQ